MCRPMPTRGKVRETHVYPAPCSLDLLQSPANVSIVCFHPFIFVQKMSQATAQNLDVGILSSSVGSVIPHDISGKNIHLNLVPQSTFMVSMLTTSYHLNDLHVIAHNNVVQQIRKGGGGESKGLHFAAEEDAMTVPLCVVCTGNGWVKEDLKKMV
jgi:hypothetical protein